MNGWENIGNKIKMKYDGFEWQQVKVHHDIFEDINTVSARCGNGDTFEEATCWLDAFNWSVMNKTHLTEDIYQFIAHRSGVMRRAIDNEITNLKFSENEVARQMRLDLWNYLYEHGTNLVYFVNTILGG